MRGKMKVSLPEDKQSVPSNALANTEKDLKVVMGIASREACARSMNGEALEAAVKRLGAAQRSLDNSMVEWKLLQQGGAAPSEVQFIAVRKAHLLKTISDMRKRVNIDASLLYCHDLLSGQTEQPRVGKLGYPDLNNQTPMVLALERLGLPLLMDDILSMVEGPPSDESLGDNDLLKLLHGLRSLGVCGRRYTFHMNSTRDELTIKVVGTPTFDASGTLTLKDLFGPDIGPLDGAVTMIERPKGSANRYLISNVGQGELLELEPKDQEVPKGSLALIKGDIIGEISQGRSSLEFSVPSGPLAHRRAALQVVMDLLARERPPMVELEDEDGKGAKEYLVDELDMSSRKVVLIDPVKPKGVPKTTSFYGSDLDKVLARWGRRSYVVTIIDRRSGQG